jgi:sortase (surface protein transpeptidase)
VSIAIDEIGVEAAVVPVGLDSDGSMAIPRRVADVGWYRVGAIPGRPGSAVIAGHVDSRTQGRGAFYELRALRPGVIVTLHDARGKHQHFEVVARRRFPKHALPASLFASGGGARLALITCGGSFDSVERSYRDNVVVFAVPALSPGPRR